MVVKHDLSFSKEVLSVISLKKSNIQQVFSWQSFVLNIFGLWYRSPADAPKGCTLQRVRHFIYLILIIPATPISLYLVVRSLAALSGDQAVADKEERPVVRALALLPNIAIAIRAICVILFLSAGHIDLRGLICELEILVGSTIPKEKLLRHLSRWTIFNTVVVIYCVGSFFPVCVLNGFHMTESLELATNGSVMLKPFTLEIPVWAYVMLEAMFSWFPYVLSQLVLLCMVTSCLMVFDCFTALNNSLTALEAKMPGVAGKERQLEAELNWTGSCIELDLMTSEVETLMNARAGLFHFIERLNHNLGFVILFSYLSDVVSTAGMLTVLVTHEEQSSVSFPAKLLGTIVFISYATVLYIPMVLATESAGHTNLILYRITMEGYALIKAQVGNGLGNVLADFRLLITMFPVHLSAARIFHIDRNFIVASFSLLFTFAILLEELLGQMSVKALIEQASNTSSLLEAMLGNSTNVSVTSHGGTDGL
ncbi:hypothetical protein BV898_05140 [Hypsibius exemplaris]|uniref:Gustatory receptor n=1 Tax=Hypsibius exemplaris TaxID=2072580 RepID=A0A1W0WZZ9_HYPEX|nr:hypothetical protein BV898_05140 [Hypsibius exemplaris]